MELNDAARALIGAGADATLITINPDGSPQVSVVWVALQSTPDGDDLVAAHLSGNYKKLRNIRRDPHVALTVLAPSQPGQQREYLAVTGSARVVEGGAPELLNSWRPRSWVPTSISRHPTRRRDSSPESESSQWAGMAPGLDSADVGLGCRALGKARTQRV